MGPESDRQGRELQRGGCRCVRAWPVRRRFRLLRVARRAEDIQDAIAAAVRRRPGAPEGYFHASDSAPAESRSHRALARCRCRATGDRADATLLAVAPAGQRMTTLPPVPPPPPKEVPKPAETPQRPPQAEELLCTICGMRSCWR